MPARPRPGPPRHPEHLERLRPLAGEAGDAVGAAAALEELLTDCLGVLGPDHPDTLTTRGSLARWRARQGTPLAPLQLWRSSSPIGCACSAATTLAPWQPEQTHQLAGRAGDATGAAAAMEELLTDRLRVLGSDHPDTLTTRGNLAYWRGQAGMPVPSSDNPV
jgi:hypothetical protein